MKYNSASWFTLIELMVVITIIGIISLATYMPYDHHQKKTLVKQAVKELGQTLTESRNLAIHGLDTGSGNVYVWVYIEAWSQKIDYFTATWALDILNLPSTVYKTKTLPRWVEVFSINGDEDQSVLMSFSPITGSWNLVGTSGDIVSFILSYKWTTSPVLQKELTYYRKSFISDY